MSESSSHDVDDESEFVSESDTDDSDINSDTDDSDINSDTDDVVSDDVETRVEAKPVRTDRITRAVQTTGSRVSTTDAQTQTVAAFACLDPESLEDDISRALSVYAATDAPEKIVGVLDRMTSAKETFGDLYETAKREIALRAFLEKNSEFACPILGTLMRDPVFAVPYEYGESHTYERRAIQQHINMKRRAGVEPLDPLSNKRIRSEVWSNVAIRAAIESALKRENM